MRRSREARLTGRTAVVSGGAGGAGAATSRLFANEGAHIAIVDIDQVAGSETIAAIRSRGGTATFHSADVSQPDQIAAAFSAIRAQYERIDILVNHAGRVIVKPFLDTSDDEWLGLFETNVMSMVACSREVIPTMLLQGHGVIVNTASISGFTASSMESAYCVTKGAVIQLTRSLAAEFRDRGIRCNALCPGFIRTRHGSDEIAALAKYGQDASGAAMTALQGRMAEPEEVARAALFLACDDASFVNGACLVVDNAATAIT